MVQEWLATLEQTLVGRHASIVRREYDWLVVLEGGGAISLPIPWRIVADGRIAFANRDDGQRFGLPAPIEGESEATSLLNGRAIRAISVDAETADLSLMFEGGVRLDAFNHSSGYEGWQIDLPAEHDGMSVTALGGGDVALWSWQMPY